MKSNASKRLTTHSKYLKISRKGVSKNLEPLYVYFLRGSEKVCKLFDSEDSGYEMGLDFGELQNINQENYDRLYDILFSYFTLMLSGENIPGSYKERIQTTKSIIGDKYQKHLLNKVQTNYGNVSGQELWNGLTKETSLLIKDELNAQNINLPELEDFLIRVSLQEIGINAANIKGKSGCYIATDIYGDYNHDKVIILRNYRDFVLSKSNIGTLIIKLYYNISPTIVNTKILKTKFKAPVKLILDKVIQKLKTKYPKL